MGDNIKMDLQEMGPRECGNESSGSVKRGEFLG